MSVKTLSPKARLLGQIRTQLNAPKLLVLNVLLLVVAALVLPPVLNWAIFDAVWSGESGADCPRGKGACWAFIGAKFRLILFGRYVYAEQWRPFLATLLLVGLVVMSLNPKFWRKSLALAWIAGLAVYGTIMWGGVLGLTLVPSSYWGGLPLTILLTTFGVFFGLIISVPVALARVSQMPVFRYAALIYTEIVRGVPLISVLFLASVVLPQFLPEGLTPNGLGRVLIGIVIFFSAYMAEVLRGGLQSIPKGQYEASTALGLSYWAVMVTVILPQVFETVLPALINLIIGALKGTSLVVIVAMMDLLGAAQAALADPNWIGFYLEAYVFAGLIYALMCGCISWYGRKVENTLAQARRH
jgi:general L-amino acid transport system permease protein